MIKEILKRVLESQPLQKVYPYLRRLEIPERVYKHLRPRGIFNAKTDIYNFNIYHYGCHIENTLYWTGFYEKNTLILWSRIARLSNVIMDVGANTGIFSLAAKSANKKAQVYAFEPQNLVYKMLNKNIEINRFDIISRNFGLSDQERDVQLWVTEGDNAPGASINPDLEYWKNIPNKKTIPIEVRRGDNFLREQGIDQVDLIKMDVEGHEPYALEGLGQYLHSMPSPTLIVEILNESVCAEIKRIVSINKYLFYFIDESLGLIKLNDLTFYKMGNYLICEDIICQRLGLSN